MKTARRVPVINHELAELQAKRIFEFCLIISILALIFYFGLGNFIAGTPEPEFWLTIEAAERALWEAIVR